MDDEHTASLQNTGFGVDFYLAVTKEKIQWYNQFKILQKTMYYVSCKNLEVLHYIIFSILHFTFVKY